MNYKLIGKHAEDTAEGAVLAPGETTSLLSAFDPDSEHNRRLIDEGLLIPVGDEQEPNATDGAQALAAEHNLGLAAVTGTGADGRITKEDVERHLAEASREETS